MAIRLSGMVSGLDTDSIVQALMSSQKYKKTKIEANKQKLEWKQELWSDMNKKVLNFYKSSLGKIRMQSTFKTKNAASSDASKVTATASANAAEGTYRVKVNSVASAQYVTSGKLQKDANNNEITGNTKLVDLKDGGIAAGTQIALTAENGSKKTYLTVDENTTVSDFVSAAKSIGLNASFDQNQQRFFISSSTSGKDQAFTIQASTLSASQAQAVSDWKNAIGYDSLSSGDKVSVTTIFNDLQSGAKTYADVEDSLKTFLSNSRENAINAYYKEQITNQMYTDDTQTTVSDLGLAILAKTRDEVNAMSADDIKSAVTKAVNNAMSSDEVKNSVIADKESGVRGTTLTIEGASVPISAASTSFLSSSRSALESSLGSIASSYGTTMSSGATTNNAILNKLGLSEVTGTTAIAEDTNAADGGMVVVKAEDAEITFNGATLTSSNSTISVNGLTLNILDESKDKELTITVTKDTSAVYDAIKDFISEYNSILGTMNTSYNAASAKGYDVLTDDQKKEMSDDEVEKWENKIKSSLLRRDDTLNSLISSFRNDMMISYTASNGKRYSLASLGIMTSDDYTEKGLLHIKGDEDDDTYADVENQLKKMLDSDPDLVMEIMTGIATTLYDDLTKKMSSNSYSSTMTFYNDKQMAKQMTQYKKDISTWETKLADLEDRYYKQFTAMEKALANSQSQSNSLAGFFG